MSSPKQLTPLAQYFLEPANPTHRQYEALRAYFVEGLSAAEVAERFGYTPGSFRVLAHHFRHDPQRAFFLPTNKGPHAPIKRLALRDRVIALRKQNLSIYDISRALQADGQPISPVAIDQILKAEGFARLPRRDDDDKPPAARPITAEVADVQQLDLRPRTIHTKFGGLFLFLPTLATLPLDRILRRAAFPGSQMIPAAPAVRSLLALKLFGNARHSHVMSYVLDDGLALFAGLNAIPQRSFLADYSCRIDPNSYPALMRQWFDALSSAGLPRGTSFDLDFHTIPHHGNDPLLEKHYVSKRSRRQKGILAFLAHDADTRVFCYAQADIRKQDQHDEVLNFVAFWRRRTGRVPEELIFDSKLTTYANLNRLNDQNVNFITLRRRSPQLLQTIAAAPASAWRRVELDGVSRLYKTPRVWDRTISLADYDGPIRQIVVTDLGHEQPTVLLTNQRTRSAAKLIERYAQRMLIENHIEDGIDFFHMDALSSAVALRVTCDLQLTLMASSLYRLLGQRLGHGYEVAKSRHLFRDFIDATAWIRLTEAEVVVRFQRRAHNPLLLAAGFGQTDTVIPWLGRKRLRIELGQASVE
jgi:Transposase DDE domain